MIESRRTWSLLDIVQKTDLYAALYYFHEVCVFQCAIAHALKTQMGGRQVEPAQVLELLKKIHLMEFHFGSEGLHECQRACTVAKADLQRPLLDASSINAYLQTFKRGLMAPLEGIVFLRIDPSRKPLVDANDLFGDAVASAFPSAGRDLREAGNSLACECSTAAVFHLMRAVEFAIRALARDRDIDFKDKPLEEKQWGEVLGALEGCLNDMRKAARANWVTGDVRDVQIRFYNEVVQELRSFNDAWRRHVSHADTGAFYDIEQASSIMNHVRACMQKLATKISEEDVTPKFWTTV